MFSHKTKSILLPFFCLHSSFLVCIQFFKEIQFCLKAKQNSSINQNQLCSWSVLYIMTATYHFYSSGVYREILSWYLEGTFNEYTSWIFQLLLDWKWFPFYLSQNHVILHFKRFLHTSPAPGLEAIIDYCSLKMKASRVYFKPVQLNKKLNSAST